MTPQSSSRLRPVFMLALGTAFWGLTFPLSKGLSLAQTQISPGSNGWFIASASVAFRFLLATFLLVIWNARQLPTLRTKEGLQGMLLGLTGGIGLLFQIDGLQYTTASTSAFLTQLYCLILPILFALRNRRLPSLRVGASSLMVLLGVAVLSQMDWKTLKLGRGEFETLLASLFFTGQILVLDQPTFNKNRASLVTLSMFVVGSLLFLSLSLATSSSLLDFVHIHSPPAILFDSIILSILCTLAPYTLMNTWQPRVSAIQAGLIYCTEPIFATVIALFLPAMLSSRHHVNYPNEHLTWSLALGGTLILAANILIQTERRTVTNPQPEPHQDG